MRDGSAAGVAKNSGKILGRGLERQLVLGTAEPGHHEARDQSDDNQYDEKFEQGITSLPGWLEESWGGSLRVMRKNQLVF